MVCLRRKILMLLTFSFSLSILSGCVSYTPPNNVDFASVKDISEFNGVYRNRGRSKREPQEEDKLNIRVVYLSSLFWHTLDKKENASIQSIEIENLNNQALVVKAIGKNGVEKEGFFVKGRDFELSSGKIHLAQNLGIPYPIVGLGYKSFYLGLDLRRDGKYKESTTVAGLVFLVLPIAITGTEEIRFERIVK